MKTLDSVTPFGRTAIRNDVIDQSRLVPMHTERLFCNCLKYVVQFVDFKPLKCLNRTVFNIFTDYLHVTNIASCELLPGKLCKVKRP